VLLLVCAGFGLLGRWQLERAEVNRNIEQQFAEFDALPALEAPLADVSVEQHRFRRITRAGHYRPEIQILLDNMTHDGVAGYQVLTPFVANGTDRLLLVNRGWVAASWDRSVLPDAGVAGLAASISGRIDRLPRAGLDLGASAAADGPLRVLSFPTFDQIEAELGRPVHAFQLLLDPAETNGFERNWGPPEGRADRNIAYAVQWFALAVLALSIAIGAVVRCYRIQTESNS
jgi:surfeit locus 1 family protein